MSNPRWTQMDADGWKGVYLHASAVNLTPCSSCVAPGHHYPGDLLRVLGGFARNLPGFACGCVAPICGALIPLLLLLMMFSSGWAEVLLVAEVPASVDAELADKPLASIQSAIDAALNGDTVVVQPGKYVENINFKGKAITLRSKDPQDLAVVAATIIDGGGKGSVVTFNSREGSNSVISGFTIAKGRADWGGGIYCGPAAVPTILNNRIIENTASIGGGGIYCASSLTASRNLIASNHANLVGGGIFADMSSWPVITSNLIVKNSAADSGGGIFCASFCIGRIINNTIAYNSAPVNGGGLYCDVLGRPWTWNCIFWGNGDDLFGWGGLYLCVEDTGNENEGEGNIHLNPRFVNAALGDYHLVSTSPCIGKATTAAPSMPTLDFEGEPMPYKTRADIGADEFVDSDSDTLPDFWERDWFGGLSQSASGDPDSDQLSNGNELVAGTDPKNPDTDGDDCLDGVEFFADTDPLDPDSFFKTLKLSVSGTLVTMEWATVPGRWYRAYFSDNLQFWLPAAAAQRATGGFLRSSFIITKTTRARFFRIHVLP